MVTKTVVVQPDDFSVEDLYISLSKSSDTGAVAMFVGLVRDFSNKSKPSNPDSAITRQYPDKQKGSVFELEHYPGMTERNIQSIVDEASSRWSLQAVSVVHRVGKLSINDQIVFVGVSSAHRAEAFLACDFIMDYLKSRAAFWKKESSNGESNWVEAKTHDEKSLERWR